MPSRSSAQAVRCNSVVTGYDPLFVDARTLTIVLLAAGIPLCLFRMWLIWWRGQCSGCRRTRSACVCRMRR